MKGYVVHIIRNKKVYKKNFISSKLSMDIKYNQALEYKDFILKNMVSNIWRGKNKCLSKYKIFASLNKYRRHNQIAGKSW